MGGQVDSKLSLKYEKWYEGEKLSYISFFSSLESLQDPEIVPCIKKALEYWDEFKIPNFQKMRLNLEIQLIMCDLSSINNVEKNSKAKLDSLIKELESIKSNELIEQKTLILYYIYMDYSERANDLLKYFGKTKFLFTNFIEVTEKYINLGVKFYENVEFMWGTFQKLINLLIGTDNLQKANELAEKELIFTKEFGK